MILPGSCQSRRALAGSVLVPVGPGCACRLSDAASNLIWLNDGKGHFTDSHLRLGNSNSAAVALGDINQDGKTDAVVVNTKLDKKNNYEAVPSPLEIWINQSLGYSDCLPSA